MCRNVAITLFLTVVVWQVSAPPPVRVTIDCGTEREAKANILRPKTESRSRFDVRSFCDMIHNAIPKAVEDGKFVLEPDDQDILGDTQYPIAITPPKPFLALPRIKLPNINIPKITRSQFFRQSFGEPIIRRQESIVPKVFKEDEDEEDSAERMQKFKKGVQKLLHVVKVLGQVDQYLSERTRIVIDKLSKTFAE